MTAEKIRSIIKEIVKEELSWHKELPIGALAEELDSINRLSLMVAIEDHFQIIFEPSDEENITTIDDLISMIAIKQEEQKK